MRRLADYRAGTVLLLESDSTLRLLVHRMLQQAGYRVLVARARDEAMILAQQSGARIDLLLTGFSIPETCGLDLAERLTDSHPEVRALCLCPREQTLPEAAATQLGERPFATQMLLRRVHRALADSFRADRLTARS